MLKRVHAPCCQLFAMQLTPGWNRHFCNLSKRKSEKNSCNRLGRDTRQASQRLHFILLMVSSCITALWAPLKICSALCPWQFMIMLSCCGQVGTVSPESQRFVACMVVLHCLYRQLAQFCSTASHMLCRGGTVAAGGARQGCMLHCKHW